MFSTKAWRSVSDFAILLKRGPWMPSPPPIEISTLTPAACAFLISAGSIVPAGMSSVPSALAVSSTKACAICVSFE